MTASVDPRAQSQLQPAASPSSTLAWYVLESRPTKPIHVTAPPSAERTGLGPSRGGRQTIVVWKMIDVDEDDTVWCLRQGKELCDRELRFG